MASNGNRLRGLKGPACPLCDAVGDELVETEDARRYLNCPRCRLIYLHPDQRLPAPDERARYDFHNNNRGDPGYVLFLRRLADPLRERLRPGARGLDFGCGPTPVLSEMLTAAGFPCAAYDPFFSPDKTVLDKQYDFITCSEVVEHAHDPARMFATLQAMLLPGGVLGVMTMFHPGGYAFADWWYRRDPTHVCFYGEATMHWIGEQHDWRTEFPRTNVTLYSGPIRP